MSLWQINQCLVLSAQVAVNEADGAAPYNTLSLTSPSLPVSCSFLTGAAAWLYIDLIVLKRTDNAQDIAYLVTEIVASRWMNRNASKLNPEKLWGWLNSLLAQENVPWKTWFVRTLECPWSLLRQVWLIQQGSVTLLQNRLSFSNWTLEIWRSQKHLKHLNGLVVSMNFPCFPPYSPNRMRTEKWKQNHKLFQQLNFPFRGIIFSNTPQTPVSRTKFFKWNLLMRDFIWKSHSN